ncbi:low molecular weight phosphatase family protein [Nocardioides sp. MAH-18]|uniref:Low molecular weight phosphatase family protein n=1 Tax=Nocardioides agri TaxID=2682843 RepID=A0A6L6XS46_9ACTN|nr:MULTISPECIES: low molecular weight phosphatase family protein [unclassified Nocardioides]MBA2954548.1 low molecular weight phosphatase family protein [Nocardioides sp. CGMCC 1.13656]MVQ49407.1 low molecular weight phosphatase family protein [Nocardioides sp. MAH-18]
MAAVPFHILTVCVGNVCRSPLAERLLQQRLDQVAPGRTVVSSAGVGAVVGSGMDVAAASELARLGGSGEGFVARQLTGAILRDADLVLTATRDVRTRALAEHPGALRRAFTLPELAAILSAPTFSPGDDAAALVGAAARSRGLAAGVDLDIADPIGRSAEVHRQVADAIDEQVAAIAAGLGSALTGTG